MNPTAWRALVAIFVFSSGTAMGAVAFAALLEITGAEWAGRLRLTAEAFRRFLPASLLLYAVLLVGASALYPWIAHPSRTPWLRFWPLALRDAAGLIVVYAAANWFCARSDPDRSSSVEPPASASAVQRRRRRAGIFLIVYAVGGSLLIVDVLMSLEPSWTSTLFPAYVLTASLYTGIAAVVIVSAWSAPPEILDGPRANDAGNLLLGFALVWMYLLWSQFLVIWYGNLTEEVGYLIRRFEHGWRLLAWTVIAMRFLAPCVVFLGRRGRRRQPLVATSALIVVGFLLECFLLVGPRQALTDQPSAASGCADPLPGTLLPLPSRRGSAQDDLAAPGPRPSALRASWARRGSATAACPGRSAAGSSDDGSSSP